MGYFVGGLTIEKSGDNFIDQNHSSLLDGLQNLEDRLKPDFDLEVFVSSVDDFVCALENHFLHEETVLRAIKFPRQDEHTIRHRTIALGLRNAAIAMDSYETALDLLLGVRSDILNHEMIYDQEYWFLLEPAPKHDDLLIVWGPEYETGNSKVDAHHRALVAHLNKYHTIFFDSASRTRACSELRSLHAYSKLHFQVEHKEIGSRFTKAHANQHEKLLNGLDKIIADVSSGEMDIGSVSSYLKYWFINHLKNFDIPAFKIPE